MPGNDRETEPVPPFVYLLPEFMATLEAAAELLDVIAPQVAALDEKAPFGVAPALEEFGDLPDDRRDEAIGYVEQLGEFLQQAAERAESDDPDEPEGENAKLEIRFRDGEGAALVNRRFQAFLRRVFRPRDERLSILLRALVTTSVSAFEILVGGLMSEYYRRYPGALGSDAKEFSLDDLSQFDTVEDARSLIIQKRVDQMLYGSFDEWAEAFLKRMNIDFQGLALDWEATREVFARRNALVHAGGRVSRQYLKKVGDDGDLDLGAALKVDEGYVREALDHLAVLGLLAGTLTWVKLVPEDAEQAWSQLSAYIYEFMLQDRWAVVKGLCTPSCTLAVPDRTKLIVMFNGWLARKRLDDPDVLDEVRRFDASALGRDFQLVQLALLDDIDEALALLKEISLTGELPPGAPEEWPALAELRAHPEFSMAAGHEDAQGVAAPEGPPTSSTSAEPPGP